MSTCGEVIHQFVAPPAGSPMAAILHAYLNVGSGLTHDVVDAAAVAELNQQTTALGSDASDALRGAVTRLAGSKDLASARAAFQSVGGALAGKLQIATP